MPVQLGLQTLQSPTTTPYKLYRTTLFESSLAAHKPHQQTTYITKHRYSHYKTLLTCEGHNFYPHPVQIQTTLATTCWRTNQLHVASKLPYKHYTLDSSTPSPNTLVHTSTRASNLGHTKARSKRNIRYSSTRNTPLRTRTTTCGRSTPQQASLQTSHSSCNLLKENRRFRRRSLHTLYAVYAV